MEVSETVAPRARAMPKSMRRGPSRASSTLDGFTSRWTTPWPWTASSASARPAPRVRTAGSGSGPCSVTAWESGHQVVGVAQVLHEGDRTDVQVPPDELLAEALRGVLGELQVEQGSRARQAPVERQAVQELDVADAGPAATVLVAFTGGDG
ncbi:hypothetical protein SCALM49S_00038 [Streptomyces californicus]